MVGWVDKLDEQTGIENLLEAGLQVLDIVDVQVRLV